MDERGVLITWRSLFNGKDITQDSICKAEALLDDLSGESPLHVRLARELEELKSLVAKGSKRAQRTIKSDAETV